MDEQYYNSLVKKYGEEVVLNGYDEFAEHYRKRKKALDDLANEKIKQDYNYSINKKLFGGNKKFDYEGHKDATIAEFEVGELNIALKNGCAEKGEERANKEKPKSREELLAEFKKQFQTDAPVKELTPQKSHEKSDPKLAEENSVQTIEESRENKRKADLAKFMAEMKANEKDITKKFER